MSEYIIQGTDANFDQIVGDSDVPVLVDFWAPWCGPCKMIGPVLEELAQEYEGRAKIVKVNVDDEQKIAGQLGIRSIPTLVLYRNGNPAETMLGARPKAEFVELLDNALSN
ncbi:MAG: thioredoxin [bacterium]|nr:thioredoxin [bacterium]